MTEQCKKVNTLRFGMKKCGGKNCSTSPNRLTLTNSTFNAEEGCEKNSNNDKANINSTTRLKI
jgi:hypothetical protein